MFPAVWSVLTWSYLSWILQGDPLSFVRFAEAVVLGWAPVGGQWKVRWEEVLRLVTAELASVPVAVVVGVLVLRAAPRGGGLLVGLLSVPTLARLLGLRFPTELAVTTYTLIAAMAVPSTLTASGQRWLVVLAALQLATGTLTAPWPWERFTPAPGEAAFARQLAALPPRSVLLDDRSAYRLVARAGTARPFLLPADPEFARAVEDPADWVQFVLVTTTPAPNDPVSPRLLARLGGRTPLATWGPWRLYSVRPGR